MHDFIIGKNNIDKIDSTLINKQFTKVDKRGITEVWLKQKSINV